LDLAFITRSLKLTAVLSAVGFLFTTVYVGAGWGLGFMLGAGWGIGNLYLLKRLIELSVRLEGRDLTAVGILVLVKFPLLYGLGYLILSRSWYPFWAPVIGFSLPLVVIILKAMGRVLLRIEGADAGRKPAHADMKRASR
jgi:hypothetical protein